MILRAPRGGHFSSRNTTSFTESLVRGPSRRSLARLPVSAPRLASRELHVLLRGHGYQNGEIILGMGTIVVQECIIALYALD